MTKGKKILIAAVVIVLLGTIVGFTVSQSSRSAATVQTSKVSKSDLTSVVSASGEIKPKTYANIGALSMGKIVKLYVHEGDRVKAGQQLALLDNVQSSADVAAMRAQLDAAKSDTVAADAAIKTNQANLDRASASFDQAKLDFQRAKSLYDQQLIAKQDFDAKKAAYESADAAVAQAKAQLAQSKAQANAAEVRINQFQASLKRASDILSKTEYTAPYDGIVTNLPVREGETVVMGIQNSPGSTLMTVADMSVITAEVRVDETDVVNVRIGQPAEITIDAMPKKVFHGEVSDIGDNAMVRSTGVSTSQTTTGSQEAKDFKVVVTLKDAPENLRPGLSATAKITTNSKSNVVTIPIQALTVRQRGELVPKASGKGVQAAAPAMDDKKAKEEVQGVFIVKNKKAEFIPVETGITGTTDIEVTKGLTGGEEIVTGSYKVLRSLRPGATVKVDNTAPKKVEEASS